MRYFEDFQVGERIELGSLKVTEEEMEPILSGSSVARHPSRRFFLYEQYRDQSALDTHRASLYFAQYVTNGLFNILEKREAEIYVPLQ